MSGLNRPTPGANFEDSDDDPYDQTIAPGAGLGAACRHGVAGRLLRSATADDADHHEPGDDDHHAIAPGRFNDNDNHAPDPATVNQPPRALSRQGGWIGARA